MTYEIRKKVIIVAAFPQLTCHFSRSQPGTLNGRATLLKQNTLWLFDIS